MKTKKEYLILAVVIVALGLYLTLRSTDRTHFKLPVIDSIDTAQIDRVVIAGKDKNVELTRRDGQWQIQPDGFKADPVKVKNMLKVVEDLTLSDLVSEAGDYQRYDLTDDQRIRVTAWSGNTKRREFDMGKSAGTFQHTYVRLPDDPKVYHARGTFRHSFDVTAETLRDRTVMQFSRADIRAVELRKKDTVRVLTMVTPPAPPAADKKTSEKDEKEKQVVGQPFWQADDGSKADQTAMDRLLTNFSDIKCEKFDTAKKKTALSDPQWSVTFKAADKAYTFSVYAKQMGDDAVTPAVSSAAEQPFYMTDARIKALVKQIDDLMGVSAKSDKKTKT